MCRTTGIVMWYPEILNAMSKYLKNDHEEGVMICSAVKEDIEIKNLSLADKVRECIWLTNSNLLLYFQEAYSCTDTVNTDVFYISIIIGAIYALCYIIVGTIINIVGKKQLTFIFLITGALSGITAQNVYGYTLIQILVGIFLMGGVAIGVVNAIVVDLFPTEIRAMALSLSLMCGRLGAVTGSNIIGPLIYKACNFTFYVTALDHLGNWTFLISIEIYLIQFLVLIGIVFMIPSSSLSEKKMTEPI